MRSADTTLSRIGLLFALCVGAAGCTSRVPLGGPAWTPAQAAAAAPAPTATAPAPAPASPTAVSSPVTSAATSAAAPSSTLPLVFGSAEPAVSPAVQRAYDDARRALRAGNNTEAERAMKALAQSNPELGGPHANLGVIYRQAGKLKEAVAEGEKAVRANPRQPVYQNQLGISYRHNGQFDKAREAYEAAIALDPAYASPIVNLGILHDLYLADSKRALELYDRYLAMQPGGDAVVAKWVADLRNRKPAPVTVSQKEKP
jgi:Flp pilus assembly protein TadD